MNIGEAAEKSGVSAKMVRYYESIGLLPEADRKESGYRDYAENDVHRLHFVKLARELGFSMERIKALLALWGDERRSNADVRRAALDHVAELEVQAQKLQAMTAVLQQLMDACSRGYRPRCPIITELGRRGSMATTKHRSSDKSRKPH